ncbi:hypothetical protein [Sulfurospirillum cavolei]|uniref:hypothetical protein n=1 Tax=Sulfurospirillum cavolei TaxID=366522 RepID=UPI0005A8CD30|nr:hypothetical protein [Sulfurospirillum cavolei]
MKAFLQSILGVNALKAQIDLLKQELTHMRAENERIQLKLSGLGKYPKVDLKESQAAGILRIVDDFKARRCGGNICKR